MIEEVTEVVWLENPFNYDCVRESNMLTTSKNGAPGKHGTRIIGFENHKKHGKGIQAYTRRYWWLKEQDKDCSAPHPSYQSGKIRPSEAISPKDIVIPEGVRVLKPYEIEQSVPEYGLKQIEKQNAEWKRCERAAIPKIQIRKGTKYGNISYDFYTIGFDLSEEAHKKLHALVIDFMKRFDTREYRNLVFPKGSSFWSMGPNYGATPRMRNEETRILAGLMKEIILDKTNWVPLEATMFPGGQR